MHGLKTQKRWRPVVLKETRGEWNFQVENATFTTLHTTNAFCSLIKSVYNFHFKYHLQAWGTVEQGNSILGAYIVIKVVKYKGKVMKLYTDTFLKFSTTTQIIFLPCMFSLAKNHPVCIRWRWLTPCTFHVILISNTKAFQVQRK